MTQHPVHNQSPEYNKKFWDRVQVTDDCWIWIGHRDKDGYGVFYMTIGGKTRTKKAHRYSYERYCNELLPGLMIDHKCRNRSCVNPAHLQQVTNGLNQQNRSGLDSRNQTGYRGVTPRDGRFGAYVIHEKKMKWLGVYDTASEAGAVSAQARDDIYTNENPEIGRD